MSNDKAEATYHAPVRQLLKAEPTQVRHPRQAALRTAFQALVGLAVVLPLIVAETGLNVDQVAWLAPVLAVAAGVSRVMAIPAVDDWLEKIGLGATPKPLAETDPPEDTELDDNEENAS